MPLTFGQFKDLVAPYAGPAGKSPNSKDVPAFARQVMEYLLFSGSDSANRKLSILAYKGCIVFPPEVEIPLKARIDNRVAEMWNKWYTFHSVNDKLADCFAAGEIIAEDGSQSPLAYPLPPGGGKVGIMGHCEECDDSFVIVQGKDTVGLEVYTYYDGERVVGEKFKIQKNTLRTGSIDFSEITGVTKSRTNGYVSAYSVTPQGGQGQFLADWSPSEERPLYRRYKVISRSCAPLVHVTIICRVRLKDNYEDNELTLFDNYFAVTLAAQRIQSEKNNDSQTANYKREAVEDLLEKEAGYKKQSGSPVDVFFPLSGGAIKNIIR